MGTPVDLREWDFVGSVVYLGVSCPTCGVDHPCDIICFRFSPTIYRCVTCNTYKRHRPMTVLIRQYQMNQLLRGLTTT